MNASLKMPFQDFTPDTASIYNQGMATVQNCLPYLAAPNYAQSPGLSLTAIGQPNVGTYTANAVKLDGSTTYLSKSGNLTSIANGKTFSFSLWIRLDSSTGGQVISLGNSSFNYWTLTTSNVANEFSVIARNSAGTIICQIATGLGYSGPGTTWYNILCSVNLGTGVSNLYVNNVSDNVVTTLTNDTINFAASAAIYDIGSSADGAPSIMFNGCLAELWWDTSFIDFSNSTNRAKFISSGLPVNLGTTGQTPTGSSPLLYLKSAAAQFGTNSGTGGNLTQNGTFAIASSSPSGATPSQYLGSGSFIDSGNSPHTYAGNSSQLVEITATTATNVSKSGGYACTTFWKFAQYGNNIYATDYADNIQTMAVGGTAFADLTGGPPKAKAIAQIGQFVIVGNTNGGTYGGSTAGAVPNRVWWPQINTPTNWPDPLAQAAIGQQAGVQDLPEIYGEVRHISNGQLWGLVFQEHAISNFYYVGGNVVFQVNTYEKQRGLYCPNGACQIGNLVYFPDASGFFVTDGAIVEPIGHDKVDKTWLNDVNTAYLDHVRASHDAQNKCIWWSYVSTGAALQGSFVSCDKVIVYNYADKRWGLGYTGQTIDMIFDAHTLGYTMEQLDSVNSNLDLITPSLDSPYWNGGLPIVGAFGIQQIGSTGSYASYYGTFTGAALTATLQTKTVNINQGGRALVTAIKPIVTGVTGTTNAKVTFNTPPVNAAILTWTDDTYVNPQPLGTGNALSESFTFLISGLPYTPINYKVYISDWEGNQLQYTTSRTNYASYSQDGSQWTLSAGVTIANNQSGAPDGTTTSNKVTQDTSTGLHRAFVQAVSGTQATGIYSCRVLVNAGTASYCQINFTDQATGAVALIFSFLTNTVLSISNSGSWTSSSFNSYSIGSGFYAIEITGNKGDATNQVAVNIEHYNGTTNSFTGDGTTYFYAWGVMFTAGSTIGSYIKTSGAAVSYTDYAYYAPASTSTSILVQLGTQTLPTDSITWSTGTSPETRTGKCSARSDGVFHTAKVTISGGFLNALGVEPEARPSGYA